MYFRLGSSLRISCSGCNVRDIAKMMACMHDGCVLFASISIISLSTCGSHSAWAPELVGKSVCESLTERGNQYHCVLYIFTTSFIFYPLLHHILRCVLCNDSSVVSFDGINLCLIILTSFFVLVLHPVNYILILLKLCVLPFLHLSSLSPTHAHHL